MERAYRFDILATNLPSLQAAADIVLSRPNAPYMKDKIRLNWDDEITSVVQLRQAQNKGCDIELNIEQVFDRQGIIRELNYDKLKVNIEITEDLTAEAYKRYRARHVKGPYEISRLELMYWLDDWSVMEKILLKQWKPKRELIIKPSHLMEEDETKLFLKSLAKCKLTCPSLKI